ncbi:MAG: response regulator [Anaerolineales bacterium]|nr:response regulator [Anaerolineales bacterium]NUQ86529.1 response regulator [Anaerolineales bacterium]
MDEIQSTILIVDDESSNRETLVSILEPEGYRLVLAEDGRRALEQAKAIQPDVILLDVMMPGLNGFEVCRLVRAEDNLAEVPVILLTALDDRQSLLEGLNSGADDFITKPFNRHELRARLKSITRLDRYHKLLEERQRLHEAHQNLLDAYDKTIEGWSRAMDLRDRETEGHTRRVTQMTLELAKMFGVESEQLTHIRRGALLHDMGKLGIPDSILLKPASLDPDEWELMRQHPQLAYDMLYPIEYLRPALDIPLCHHEKWDGAGYPRGLKGTEIPLAARLFAVVDVWDALTSDRPYRPAWSAEETLAYIREQSGKHFDPEIVELFLRMVDESRAPR